MLLPIVYGLVLVNNLVESSRILCILSVPLYSHYEAPNQLMLNLAEKGHEVTVVSPFPAKFKHENYRNITIKTDSFLPGDAGSTLRVSTHKFIKILFNLGLQASESVFKDENFRKFMASDEKFDAIILHQLYSDSLHALCYKYDVPCILFIPWTASTIVDLKLGNPSPLSYISDFYMPYTDEMTFFQRVFNCLMYCYLRFLAQTYLYPKHEELIKKYLDLDLKMVDLFKKTALVLRNSHFAINGAGPTVPNLVEIGGFHLKSAKNLTGELRAYLDDAKDGVVYFNMGTVLKSSMISKDKLQMLLKALARVERKVLWKYEDDSLDGLPENVKIVKWAPQIDVLAHPNVKVFISHGGVHSTIEAIKFKVPIVGLPIFGDQVSNLQFCQSRGFARSVIYEEMNEDNLFEAINDVLTQPKYAENVNLQSQILQDLPISQMEKAIYYIEYVIRFNGAPQLRVPAMEFPSYKQQSLDVVLFILCVITLSLYVIYKCICKCCRLRYHEKSE